MSSILLPILKKERIPVCFATFGCITGISKSKPNLLPRKMDEDGYVSDRRGGFWGRTKHTELKEDIVSFIRQFLMKESHYTSLYVWKLADRVGCAPVRRQIAVVLDQPL